MGRATEATVASAGSESGAPGLSDVPSREETQGGPGGASPGGASPGGPWLSDGRRSRCGQVTRRVRPNRAGDGLPAG